MFTGVIDSTELRSRGGSSLQAGCGSSSRSRRSVSSMEEAMREQQEKFREEMRQQQMITIGSLANVKGMGVIYMGCVPCL